jgi:hypothetical protein
MVHGEGTGRHRSLHSVAVDEDSFDALGADVESYGQRHEETGLKLFLGAVVIGCVCLSFPANTALNPRVLVWDFTVSHPMTLVNGATRDALVSRERRNSKKSD